MTGPSFPANFDVRRLGEVLLDLALLSGAYILAFLPFVSGPGTQVQQDMFQAVFPILIGTTSIVFVLLGVYDHTWRDASLRDFANLALATVCATLLAFGVVVATRELGDFSAGVFGLHALLAGGFVVGARIAMRLLPAARSWRQRASDSARRRRA